MSILRDKFRRLNEVLEEQNNKLLVLDFSHFSPKNEKLYDITFRFIAKDSQFRCEYDHFIQDAINSEESDWKKFKEGGGNQKWLVNFDPDLPEKIKPDPTPDEEIQEITKKRIENIEVKDDFKPQDLVGGFPYKQYYLPGQCLVIYAEEHGKAQSVVYLLLENKVNTYDEYDLTQGLPEGLKQFDKELSALLLNEMVESLISEKYDLLMEAKATATKASIAAIVNRNFSHHIGSHITYRATVPKIMERIGEKSFQDAGQNLFLRLNSVYEMENKLTFYKNDRNEYVSNIDEQGVPFSYLFYQDIILPFAENSLIIDNLAKSEGIEWKKDEDGQLTKSKLRIRVFLENTMVCKLSNEESQASEIDANNLSYVLSPDELGINGKYTEIIASYEGIENTNKTIATHDLPYFKQLQPDSEKFYQNRTINIEDIEIMVPDALGVHAFYSILENHIRNVAKHGDKTCIENADFVDIIIKISAPDKENYKIELTSNIPALTEKDVNDKEKGRYWFLKERLKDSLTSDLVAKGIADMRINANKLMFRDATDLEFSSDIEVLDLGYYTMGKPANSSKHTVYYNFCLKKNKRVLFLGPNDMFQYIENEKFVNYSIASESYIDFKNLDNYSNFQLYEIAVINADLLSVFKNTDFNYHEDAAHPIDQLLKLLPNKILIYNVKEGSNTLIDNLITSRRVYRLNDKAIQEIKQIDEPGKLHEKIWQLWLQAKWKRDIYLNLYFEEEGEEGYITSKYLQGAERITNGNLHTFVLYNDKQQNRPGTDKYGLYIFYDRHGTAGFQFLHMHEDRNNGKALIQMRDELKLSWIYLDKNSKDFDLIASDALKHPFVSFAKIANNALHKILILDERAMEHANDITRHPHIGKSIKIEKNLEDNDVLQNQALAARVVIPDSLSINGDAYCKKGDRIHATIDDKGISLYTENVFLDYQKDHAETFHKFDTLIIHRTILTSILEKDEKLFDRLSQEFPNILVCTGGGDIKYKPSVLARVTQISYSVVYKYFLGYSIAKNAASCLL